jgi:hypothetical protein
MSYRASAVKSVQRNTLTLGAASTSQTATLATTVDKNYAYVRALSAEAAASTLDGTFRIELTNNTTVTAYHLGAGATALTITFEVLEFFPWTMKQAIQHGTVTLTGVTSNTATITAVGSKASIQFLGLGTTADGGGVFPGATVGTIALTNSTTVTGSRASSNNNCVIGFAVIDPK